MTEEDTYNETIEPVIYIKLESGWKETEHIILNQNGSMQIYSGYDDLESCLEHAQDSTVYLGLLYYQDYFEIMGQLEHLPKCRPEPVDMLDGTIATIRINGDECSFYLESEVNTDLSDLVRRIQTARRTQDR